MTCNKLRESLLRGEDPLGEAFMADHSPEERRLTGSTFTPPEIVRDMMKLVAAFKPNTVVDCGCGSGRFAMACAEVFPEARILAVDSSPEACRLCRENLAALGLDERVMVIEQDFREFELPKEGRGSVLWIGNPPYVRHHALDPTEKRHFKQSAAALGLSASGLAGLHAHFLVRIAELWEEGDKGVLVTSAEWMDVNYGRVMREALTSIMPLETLHVLGKSTRVFDSADTTAAIFSFGMGGGDVACSTPEWSGTISIERLRGSSRWSDLLRTGNDETDKEGLVPLGSIASVHRGVVTGNNKFWVRDKTRLKDVPESLTVPIVSHAREVSSGSAQSHPESLDRLIALPADLTSLDDEEEKAAHTIIQEGLKAGIQNGYVASHRCPWWSVTPPEPPAIMMTYMARRTPTFQINEQGLPMLNVVHGIYPKKPMSDRALNRLTDYLNNSVSVNSGRTYCGGLTKFEPKEAEAILVPTLDRLEEA